MLWMEYFGQLFKRNKKWSRILFYADVWSIPENSFFFLDRSSFCGKDFLASSRKKITLSICPKNAEFRNNIVRTWVKTSTAINFKPNLEMQMLWRTKIELVARIYSPNIFQSNLNEDKQHVYMNSTYKWKELQCNPNFAEVFHTVMNKKCLEKKINF